MALRTPGAGLSGRPRLLAPVLVVLAVLLVLGGLAVSLYTDLLWFREVDYTQVFTTTLGTRALLFVGFGLLMAVIIGANLVVAYKVRPPFRPMSLEQQNLERYRVTVEPYLRPLLFLAAGVFGLFAGLSAAGRWETWLLWRNRTDFGVVDEQFGRDISYYVMTYPMQRFALGFLITALVLSVLVAAGTHYLFGGVRLQTVGEKVSPAARAHLSVLVGLIVLCKAVAYYLDRFGLAFSTRGVVEGASYTDVNAVLPAKNILIFIAVICALLFFANIAVRNILLPAGALALLVLSAVVLGGIFPAYTQQFRVTPNEIEREEQFIARNILATREAYGIADTVVEPYSASQDVDTAELQREVSAVQDARLLDPNRLSTTFEQLQRLTFYFGTGNRLDIDRYEGEDGGLQDYVVAAREVDISQLPGDQRSWINERLAYTHGNGLIAAPANVVDDEGRPRFIDTADPDGPFALDQTRIYFGEQSPSYSVANTDQPEIDGPQGLAGGEGEDQTFRYDGDGGVQLSSFVRKAAYALRFREPNLVLSGAVNTDSRLMYFREPRERVQKVAPFLELDGDPYPAAVDGRIVWIVDGYTTSSGYPYSQSTDFGEATTTSQSGGLQVQERVNYIRNSVKATVDAYDGTVTLYEFGAADPILQTWDKAFGGDLIRPESEISEDLRAHLRYPEDLFNVQRELLTQYHVEDARGFFLREDFWDVPADPADAVNRASRTQDNPTAPGAAGAIPIDPLADGPDQPPFYSVLAFPDQGSAFRLSTPLTALNRPNLAAFASVSSDPEDYGRIRVLEVSRSTPPDGPGQVVNRFLASQEVAQEIFQFRQAGAEVTFGNLLTLPAGGGLLYVQPVFVRAQGGESFPVLERVLVNFGDEVAAGETLAESLGQLFGAADPVTPTPTPTTPGTPPTSSPAPTPAPAPPTSLAAAVDAATQAFEDGQTALRAGDFVAYGAAQTRLEQALAQLAALEGAG